MTSHNDFEAEINPLKKQIMEIGIIEFNKDIGIIEFNKDMSREERNYYGKEFDSTR